jgi:hypothetical protein
MYRNNNEPVRDVFHVVAFFATVLTELIGKHQIPCHYWPSKQVFTTTIINSSH